MAIFNLAANQANPNFYAGGDVPLDEKDLPRTGEFNGAAGPQSNFFSAQNAGNETWKNNQPDWSAWQMPEGTSAVGQAGINRSLGLNANQQQGDMAQRNMDAGRWQQMQSAGLLQQMANDPNSVAQMQANASREQAMRQLSATGSPMAALQAQRGMAQGNQQIGGQAMQAGLAEKMGLQSQYGQAAGGIRGTDIQSANAQVARDNANNQWQLAQEKMAQGWGSAGLQEKGAQFASQQDYEKYLQQQKLNEYNMLNSSITGTKP